MKCLTVYFSTMAGWCSAAIAKVVFPIPPGPRMDPREASARRLLIRCLSSLSRPWNIFGEDGSREREPELYGPASVLIIRDICEFIYLVFKELPLSWDII
jgi:hypothetical protein